MRFLQSVNGSWPPMTQSAPVNLLAGVLLQGVRKHNLLSGYQVARFAVEVFPAALSAEGGRSISPFWPICFFVMLASLGLGQLVRACLFLCHRHGQGRVFGVMSRSGTLHVKRHRVLCVLHCGALQ